MAHVITEAVTRPHRVRSPAGDGTGLAQGGGESDQVVVAQVEATMLIMSLLNHVTSQGIEFYLVSR